MGLFRSGFLACLVVGSATFAQQGTPPAVPPPGAPDTNAPIPIPAIPEPTPTPSVDPNALQPTTPLPDTTLAPDTNTVAMPKARKPAAPVSPTLRGTVSAIDKNAMTITIHGKSKDETLNITSKTRIFADGKPAILADAKEGENVVAEYHTNKEKAKEALALRFGGGGAGAPEHKVSKSDKTESEVKTPPKKSTKKATTKKKSKKAAPTNSTTPLPGPDNSGVVPPGVTPPTVPEATNPAPLPGTPAPLPGANP